MNFDIPEPSVPFIDPRTNKIDREWYIYLWLLIEALGYDTDALANQQILNPPEGNLVIATLLQALAEQSVDTSSQIAGITARLGEINAAFQDAVLFVGKQPQLGADDCPGCVPVVINTTELTINYAYQCGTLFTNG